ncbi:hypothetical protein CMV_003490 [Castanea mollissima]|uniref:Ethylene-responsive nuclear family protein n=1 Tax=Castanea mollissima TaxID=60419 RepID=A0A8J4W2Y6_9ROSI|nr:hypothetical protein CMV_003490 [Castanea mollissima]
MPLPWKKQKGSRISRIVADLQSSPKRGGSLVVQTGFPTSLIDLFVQNRDRLNKNKEKKKKKKKKQENSSSNEDDIPSSPVEIQQEIQADPALSISPTPSGSVSFGVDEDLTPLKLKEAEVNEVCSKEDKNFGVVLKVMFLAVVVVLGFMSTKLLAVCITFSAFLLIIADYLCKRSCFLSVRPALESLVQRVQKGLLVVKNTKTCEAVNGVVEEVIGGGAESKSVIDEIQIVETSFVVDDSNEIVSVGPEIEEEAKKAAKKEVVDGSLVLVCTDESSKGCSRRGKAKKIFKKLVPKRLRNLKKEKKGKRMMEEESISEASSNLGDEYDTLGSVVDEEKADGIGKDQNRSVCKLSSLEEEELGGDKNSSIDQVSRAGDVSAAIGGRKEGSLGYITLLVIVLAGLAGGKVVALTITISWCFILKFLKFIGNRRRSVNVS